MNLTFHGKFWNSQMGDKEDASAAARQRGDKEEKLALLYPAMISPTFSEPNSIDSCPVVLTKIFDSKSHEVSVRGFLV